MPPTESDKVVTITMQNGMPMPDQDPVQVKKNGQRVKWCAAFDFRITIEGYGDVNYTPGGSSCAFSAKTGFFADERQYKYTISANGVDYDPILDVKP
jgi:hypothetical protein